MSGKNLRSILPAAMFAMAFLVWLQGAGAQESWQPAGGGASAWKAGVPVATTQTTETSHFTGSGNWAAGKSSFGLEKQPGGVWTDSAGLPTSISALPASARISKAKANALETNPLSGLQKPAAGQNLPASGATMMQEAGQTQMPALGLMSMPEAGQNLPALGATPMPAAGHTPIRQNKAQSSRTFPGRRSNVRTQFHMQYGTKSAAFKFPSSKSTFASSQGSKSSSKSPSHKTGLGSPFGSSNESTGLPNPLDDSFSHGGLGTGEPTDLDQDLH